MDLERVEKYENMVQALVYNAAHGVECEVKGCHGTPTQTFEPYCDRHLAKLERDWKQYDYEKLGKEVREDGDFSDGE